MTAHARNQPVMTYETATKLVARALAHATESGWAVAAVAVDPWGAIIASGRMDGVPAPVHDFAADKAYTATLGKSSHAFGERMGSAKGLELGLINRPRLCAWEGGVPVHVDGQLIGALGVSGAAGPEDVACAKAALEVLEG